MPLWEAGKFSFYRRRSLFNGGGEVEVMRQHCENLLEDYSFKRNSFKPKKSLLEDDDCCLAIKPNVGQTLWQVAAPLRRFLSVDQGSQAFIAGYR